MTSNYMETVSQYPEMIPKAFDQWLRTFGIQEEIAPILFTVTSWVKIASPPEVRPEQLTLACMDLAVSFFYLDDYQGEDYLELLEDFSRNLASQSPKTSRPIVIAHANLLQQFWEFGQPMDYFLESRQKLLTEYSFRNRVIRGEQKIDFQRYMECRRTTIYVDGWFSLWLLLENIQLTPWERRTLASTEAVKLLTTFYIFDNELHSIDRDISSGVPNLVVLLSNEQSISLNAAIAKLTQNLDEAKGGFIKAINMLLASSSTDNLRRCAQILRCSFECATASRRENPERYMQVK
ncbi:terpene synthase family protein [Calothrix sp. UHCC 0171]|uniref:terpene synthase family protein n=1 Tax=Calothrix sp. UHCC 0171 TaxID=3110245 RepID=UPI002B21575E|nr:terpene synthase family protein [Calothrix sp. UHCC 0171]MEA5574650.1 terpene synthase family protein [Calothrix sp. UHCC 0171]